MSEPSQERSAALRERLERAASNCYSNAIAGACSASVESLTQLGDLLREAAASLSPVEPSERERLHRLLSDAYSAIDPEAWPNVSQAIFAEIGHCDGGCTAPGASLSPQPAPASTRTAADCRCSAPSEEGTVQINTACPLHGDGTDFAEARRRYWSLPQPAPAPQKGEDDGRG
jgi:hypothetical protein